MFELVYGHAPQLTQMTVTRLLGHFQIDVGKQKMRFAKYLGMRLGASHHVFRDRLNRLGIFW
jgi:hypothetical protein